MTPNAGSAFKPRVVRVFVSSTFKDMQAERNILVKDVFPRLRDECERRGISWGEVDLRWGITDEERAEGQVLPICLAEIDRCRPYFIGMLGDRYGWAEEKWPAHVLETYEWIGGCEGRSITELEIAHGVLNNPEVEKHALFYFRKPGYGVLQDPEVYKERPSPEEIGKYGAEDAGRRAEARKARLGELKDIIRKGGFHVHDYERPEDLCELVYEDLSRVISQQYPEPDATDPIYREHQAHEAFAESRFKVYVPRPEYFNMLDSYLRDGGAPVVVTGDSGIGKSALLANWVKHVRETDPSISVYSHYVGATPDSADWRLMLRRLMTELQRDHGIQGNIPEDARELKKCFANWLHMASVKCRVALVLDAVNRLEDRDGAQMLSWLSSTVPANVRLVISAMQGKALDEAIERRWKIVEVRPLSVAERADLIRAYLGEYRKKLPSDIVGSIPSEEQCGNPLYLKIFLDELRQQGRHETLKDTIRAYLSARSVVDLYSMVLRRYQQDYEKGRENLVRDTCCLLLASRKGLSETELRYMLGNNGVQLQNRHWSPLYLALESALINRLGLLSFAHDYITEAVRKTYPSDLREYKQRIVEYFDHGEAADRRKAEELPWQLFSLGEWEKLAERLKEVEIVKTAWEQNQYDVKKYWTAIQDKAGKDVTFYYRDTISGDSVDDEYWLLDLSVLLRDMGFPDEAWKVQVRLAESGKISRDRRKMQVLLGNMALLLQRWGKLDEAMQLHKEEEKISRELNDRDVLQGSLGNQGTILQRQGMLKEAMQLHKEQERICRELNDRNGLQVALCNQALILKKWGRFKEAMQLHKEEEKISRELNNLESLQISLGDQALILKRWGKLDEALQLHLEEERICRELNDRYGLQASLGNHGIILQIQDKLDEALQLHREQERICRELNNRNDLPVALGNQAVILQSQGKLEEAMKLHQEEEAIYRELNNLRGAGISLGNQALILQSQDKLEEAMRLHKEEERICRDLDDLEGLQICLGNEALILKRWGKLVEAMQLHREQERISREQNNYEGIANSLFNQALILATDEKLQESLSLFEEAYNTAQVSGNIAFVREIEPVILKVREIMDARKRS